MMTPVEFERSLSQADPPSACSPALQAMWWAAKDDWNAAHEIVMKHGGLSHPWRLPLLPINRLAIASDASCAYFATPFSTPLMPADFS
jgi:hypothetical protein